MSKSDNEPDVFKYEKLKDHMKSFGSFFYFKDNPKQFCMILGIPNRKNQSIDTCLVDLNHGVSNLAPITEDNLLMEEEIIFVDNPFLNKE